MLLWLRYAFVGSLPAGCEAWVLHDTTASTWLVRHLARVLVQLLVPEVALVLLLRQGAGLGALTAFVTGACVVLLMSTLSSDMVERRSQKARFTWETAEQERELRSMESQQRTAQRYRDRVERRSVDGSAR